MIQINVNGSVVSVQETEALYCGAQNTYTCSFVFDRSWDSFLKSAVFRVNGRAITAVIDDNNSCVLPWELLVRDNIGSNIEVGVYGVSAESEILTSVWDSIGAVREGSELGSDAREPSAGVYEQVLASVKKVDDKIVSYSLEVQTLTQRAESAAAVAVNKAQSAEESRYVAAGSAAAATSAKNAVETALGNIPAGNTLVINDLTTGGTSAALSAEQGKVLGHRPNPNLLHNWYFLNPVEQRGQKEYSGTVYTVDRWQMRRSNSVTTLTCSVSVTGDGVVITNNSVGGSVFFTQTFEDVLPEGRYTLSVLVTEVTGNAYLALYGTDGTYGRRQAVAGSGVTSLVRDISGSQGASYRISLSPGASVTIKAVKLELGDVQTLAHQDSGNWVLNEIPDYGEELNKCQRYYQLFTSEDMMPADKRDFRPELRTNATSANTGTVVIDGVTYYYVHADM